MMGVRASSSLVLRAWVARKGLGFLRGFGLLERVWGSLEWTAGATRVLAGPRKSSEALARPQSHQEDQTPQCQREKRKTSPHRSRKDTANVFFFREIIAQPAEAFVT